MNRFLLKLWFSRKLLGVHDGMIHRWKDLDNSYPLIQTPGSINSTHLYPSIGTGYWNDFSTHGLKLYESKGCNCLLSPQYNLMPWLFPLVRIHFFRIRIFSEFVYTPRVTFKEPNETMAHNWLVSSLCMCVCVLYVCMYVCMCVCVYVCVCECVCVCLASTGMKRNPKKGEIGTHPLRP